MLDRLGRGLHEGDLCVSVFSWGCSINVCIVIELRSGLGDCWVTVRDIDDTDCHVGMFDYRLMPEELELLMRPV